jgi:hypothetical protein
MLLGVGSGLKKPFSIAAPSEEMQAASFWPRAVSVGTRHRAEHVEFTRGQLLELRRLQRRRPDGVREPAGQPPGNERGPYSSRRNVNLYLAT